MEVKVSERLSKLPPYLFADLRRKAQVEAPGDLRAHEARRAAQPLQALGAFGVACLYQGTKPNS